MKSYTVYMHISPDDKRYIGMTSQTPHRRWKKGKGYIGSYFNDAINKYGWNNFEHIIVAKGLTEKEAEWLEKELIKIWDTTNEENGYNIYTGGLSGYKYTKEQRYEISNRTKGENNPMYGTHRKGKESANKKSVICLTTKRIFFTAKDGAKYYKTDNSSIIKCCKGKYKSSGKLNRLPLVWRYLIWEHGKKYRIKNR